MSTFLRPYLIGLVTAPFLGVFIKPLLRSTVKMTVAISLQVKKLAAEAREEFEDITAETNAEIVAAKTATRSNGAAPKVTSPKKI